MQNVRQENRQTGNVLFRPSSGDDSKSSGAESDSWLRQEELIAKNFSGIVVIGGPTASGKNELALKIAGQFSSELINADSRQIYRELHVGTVQPSEAEKEAVPHHLYGFLPVDQSFTAADYQEQASKVILEVLQRGNLPIIVGGTGFYIKALLKGVWPVPPRDTELRKRFRRMESRKGREFLHRLLRRVDPASADAISINDTYRMIRALEIYFQSGKKRSELASENKDRWEALKFFIDIPREELRDRIRERTERMFQNGWLEEVRALLQRYPNFETMPAAASLGYRQIIHHLRGEMSLDECKEQVIRKTMQYAKRQTTWFRNQDSFVRVAGARELYKISDVLELRDVSPKKGLI